MSSLDRKKRIKELREAGAKAFADGKHIQSCPVKYMDEFQWKQGYIDALNTAAAHFGLTE